MATARKLGKVFIRSGFWSKSENTQEALIRHNTHPKHQAEEEQDGLGRDNSAVHVAWWSWSRTVDSMWSSFYLTERRSAVCVFLLLLRSQALWIWRHSLWSAITWSRASGGGDAMQQVSSFFSRCPVTTLPDNRGTQIMFLFSFINLRALAYAIHKTSKNPGIQPCSKPWSKSVFEDNSKTGYSNVRVCVCVVGVGPGYQVSGRKGWQTQPTQSVTS